MVKVSILKVRKMTEQKINIDARCIVLVPLERADAASSVIDKFNLQASIEHEAPLAMAELCLHIKHFQLNQAWVGEQKKAHLVLIHTNGMQGIEEMVHAIRSYLPDTTISELRDGRLDAIDNYQPTLDSLHETPIVHAEQIDADELSMLLDKKTQGVEE